MRCCWFFFFNDTATTEIYTLSLHDALPICARRPWAERPGRRRSLRGIQGVLRESGPAPTSRRAGRLVPPSRTRTSFRRSEEHTSELQSRQYLVCRLLLEKKKI